MFVLCGSWEGGLDVECVTQKKRGGTLLMVREGSATGDGGRRRTQDQNEVTFANDMMGTLSIVMIGVINNIESCCNVEEVEKNGDSEYCPVHSLVSWS